MGCPQSKKKDVSGENNDVTDGSNRKSRNDVIRPETESTKRVPTKTPHAYNDDPLVKGRSDDVIPDVTVPEVVSNDVSDEEKGAKEKAEFSKTEATKKSDSVISTEKTKSDPSDTKDKDEKIIHKSDSVAKDGNNPEAEQIPIDSVYIPDEEPADVSTNDDGDVVNVTDVSISQTVNEITLDNQVNNLRPCRCTVYVDI